MLGIAAAHAQEWRSIRPIATAGPLPAGAKRVETKPIPVPAIRQAAEQFAAAWNQSSGDDTLSANFYDASRHRDAMVTGVPRDAKLVLESVRGVQTLQQFETIDAVHGRVRVSTVSATLSTRLQFNDPGQGFVSVPGVNEVLLEVMEPLQ